MDHDPATEVSLSDGGDFTYTFTPRKVLRRVFDHALDHLNQIDQWLVWQEDGVASVPTDGWVGSSVTLDEDILPLDNRKRALPPMSRRRSCPGRSDEEYAEITPCWLEECKQRHATIIQGVREHLSASESDAVTRSTVGRGPASLEREAYYAGWLTVCRLLSSGMSLAQVARIRAQKMVQIVDTALAAI